MYESYILYKTMDVFTYLSLNTSWFMLVKSTPGTTDLTPILGGIIGYVESPKHGGCLSHTNCTMKSDTSLVIYQHDVFDTFIGIYQKTRHVTQCGRHLCCIPVKTSLWLGCFKYDRLKDAVNLTIQHEVKILQDVLSDIDPPPHTHTHYIYNTPSRLHWAFV